MGFQFQEIQTSFPFPVKEKVARVRLHGFSEREISIARALMMSDIESAYLERDQMQSTTLRDEFLQVRAIF